MTAGHSCRLAVVASHPIQYFTPLYRRLAQRRDIELEVFFCRDYGVREQYDKQFDRAVKWDTDQLAGYTHRFLRSVSPVHDTFSPLHAINPGIVPQMLRGFDALWVNGYTYPTNWLAVAAARARGTRILLRSELRNDLRGSVGVKGAVRDLVVRRWVRGSDALLYIGKANHEAYLEAGAREDQLFFTPYSVDVDTIGARVASWTNRRDLLRRSRGIPEDAVIALFVGKLLARKHPEAMLRLAEELRDVGPLHVVFAGSGPMETRLCQEFASTAPGRATFLGFVNQNELPEVYALADLFVMPSESEPWGLVLNEAMAAGLPPVVSRDVGASRDLVSDGETGFSFDSGDWAAMCDAARRLVDSSALRSSMGVAARARARQYSYEATVAGILAALRGLGLVGAAAGSGSRTG